MSVHPAVRLVALAALASLAALSSSAWGEDTATPSVKEELKFSPREKIERALDKKMTVEFAETPLSDVAYFFKEQLKIEIVLDTRALEDVGADGDTPVTGSLRDISAKSVLRHLLGSLDLSFHIKNDVLQITTPEVADSEMRVELYPVGDLIRGTNEFGELIEDYETLIEILENTIAQTTWDTVGGPGSLLGLQGNLVVSQTDAVHQNIAAAITAIRQFKELPSDQPLPAPKQIGGSDTPQDRAVQKALDRLVTLEFVETPLSEVRDFLREQLKVEVRLDTRSLEDAGVGSDTPVTVNLKNLRAASALRLTLGSIDLIYIVKDQVLLITTPEGANAELTCALFPVRDLVDPALPILDSLEQLSLAISESVHPTVWMDVGGGGSVMPVEVAQSLLISADQRTLAEVTDFLAKLRHNNAGKKNSTTIPVSELQTRIYKLKPLTIKPGSVPDYTSKKLEAAWPDPNKPEEKKEPAVKPADKPVFAERYVTPEDASQFLRSITKPEEWQNGEAYILDLGDQLIIRQTPLMHRRIKRLLEKLDLVQSPSILCGGLGSPLPDMRNGPFGTPMPHKLE